MSVVGLHGSLGLPGFWALAAVAVATAVTVEVAVAVEDAVAVAVWLTAPVDEEHVEDSDDLVMMLIVEGLNLLES